MKKMSLFIALFSSTLVAENLSIPNNINTLLEKYCYECHDADSSKGDIRLDDFKNLPMKDKLNLLGSIEEQIFLNQMPPEKKKKQPSITEKAELLAWVTQEVNQHQASKLKLKLTKPEYGNYINHEKLFSGEFKDVPGFTYDRRWLISEFIFADKINKLMARRPLPELNGQAVLTNPFPLPSTSGVRYYANEPLTNGQYSTMVTNAKDLADYLTKIDNNGRTPLGSLLPLIKQEAELTKTIYERKKYLNQFIIEVCEDIYGTKNKELLAKFTPIKITFPERVPAIHQINPSKTLTNFIWVILKKHENETDLPKKMVLCQEDLFYWGFTQDDIHNITYFLSIYIDKYATNEPKYKNFQPPEYQPLAKEEMKIIYDSITKNRSQGDSYQALIKKVSADWDAELEKHRQTAGLPEKEQMKSLINDIFERILERKATEEDYQVYLPLTESLMSQYGRVAGAHSLVQTIFLDSDFIYRNEFGVGQADQFGRKMLSPRDAAYAISYALTDSKPDKELMDAANNGKLTTKEDFKREVIRLLNKRDIKYIIDPSIEPLGEKGNITTTPIRKLRFFREFFGYSLMMDIFKDDKRFGKLQAKTRLLVETDMLVDYILQKDKNVFEELLLTDKFYIFHSGDNEEMRKPTDRLREFYDYFKDKDYKKFTRADLLRDHLEFLKKNSGNGTTEEALLSKDKRFDALKTFNLFMDELKLRYANNPKYIVPFIERKKPWSGVPITSEQVARYFNILEITWDYPVEQPVKVENRKGLLTHPAWLMSFAKNTETDPVHRGKWVREKLLAGVIPDIPIAVDAAIPEDPHKTLKQRLVKVTENDICWRCHEHMNPLGYTFEIFDDFGRYRSEESLEYPENLIKEGPKHGVDTRHIYKTLPVEAKGNLTGTGDKTLDGDLNNAFELIEKLSKSSRTRQSIIRHAFRYFMGRNEMLSDSKTLIEAEQVYLSSGGSFDAVIVSLLTSDSFIYRKANQEN